MSELSIRVENLSKRYQLGERERYKSLREVISRVAAAPLSWVHRNQSQTASAGRGDFWALKDVSFEIHQGEAVGIIGRNGAGKSTLLKILSRITKPTLGLAEIYGRVGSLLEVGTGFHPELTGRENIYLNGAILGMKRKEIERKFDEIVDFAEVEKFLDTPVKRFSSGMYVRLAFAVAANLEPEILLVDEVLAVGDAQFQKKCLGKMGEVAGEGRTVLFVSHQMDAITRLCRNAILLDNGQIVAIGLVENVVSKYLISEYGTTSKRSWPDLLKAPGNRTVRLLEICVIDVNGNEIQEISITEPVGIVIRYEVLEPGFILNASFNFWNEKGVNIFDSHDTSSKGQRIPKKKGIYKSTAWVPGNFFAEGQIIVGVGVITPEPFSVHFHEKDVVAFTVIDRLEDLTVRGGYVGHFPGVIRPFLKWETRIENDVEDK